MPRPHILTRGDIVVLNVQLAGGGDDLRPSGVIVRYDSGRSLSNIIVAVVTRNLTRANESTQVFIDPNGASGRGTNLNGKSVISCDNLWTINESMIAQRVGRLPDTMIAKMNEALRASLLPGR